MSEQLRTAAQAALEALEEIMGDYDLGCGRVQARALRAALAEPQPEPVTRDQIRDMVKECGIDWHRGFVPLFDGDDTNRYEVLVREVIDRYAAPQAQQPLTDEQIKHIGDTTPGQQGGWNIAFARAIEAAHGIGVKP